MSHCPSCGCSLDRLALCRCSNYCLDLALCLFLQLKLRLTDTHSQSCPTLPVAQWCTQHRVIWWLLSASFLNRSHELGVLWFYCFGSDVDQRMLTWARIVFSWDWEVLGILQESRVATSSSWKSMNLLLLLMNRGSKNPSRSNLENLKAVALYQMSRYWTTKAIASYASSFALGVLLVYCSLNVQGARAARCQCRRSHFWLSVNVVFGMSWLLDDLSLLVSE